MLDINDEEIKDICALDDLGKIGNIASNPLEFAYKLNDFEQGLEKAKKEQRKTNKDNDLTDSMTPEELLKAVQRDMKTKKQPEANETNER